MKPTLWFGVIGMLGMGMAHAGSVDVPMSLVSTDGTAQTIGAITVSETRYGLLFTPNLKIFLREYTASMCMKKAVVTRA